MEGQNRKPCKKTSLLHLVMVLFIFRVVLGVVDEAGKGRSVRVRQGAPFKIALFADLHFGEDAWTSWGPLQDDHSLHVMSCVLDLEKPGNNIPIANASAYWKMALSPTKERGIPWASVFGNHDDAHFVWPLQWFLSSGIPTLDCSSAISSSLGEESCSFMGTTRLQLMDHDINNNNNNNLSFSQKGPRNLWPSVSNYVLKISSSNYDSDSPVAFLYFLDSGGGSYPEVISNAQIKWFNCTSQEINPDSRVPEIIFWHIPSRAYNIVAPSSKITRPCVGSINEESVASLEAEDGIMNVLEARPSVQAVLVGHNHGLDWCCPYKNLWLCYARHTGYGGYGNWARGARILEITEQPFSLKSWITMEDSGTHSHVVLSS